MNEMKEVILTMVAAVLATSGMAQSDCGELLDANQDGLIGVEDLMNLLSHFGDSDLDYDGVFDSVDDCVGEYDECGVCNGPGIPEGYCDCGLMMDALGICGGDCAEDYDNDGVCDQFVGPCYGMDFVIYDGFDYSVAAIEEQCWFIENLRTELYANGDSIITNLSGSEWANTSDGAQTVYNNDLDNLDAFGRLYNWYAVSDDRGLCPTGWHVPSDEDWIELEIALGMDEEEVTSSGWRGTDQGEQLKSSPEDEPSWDGSNSAGFSALPGGLVTNHMGTYSVLQSHGFYWSTSLVGMNSLVWTRRFTTGASTIQRSSQHVRYGFSVRCIKDAE